MEPRRRVHADGSVSWHAHVSWTDARVIRRRKRVTARTKRDCERLARETKAAGEAGQAVGLDAARTTLGEFLARWLASLPDLAPATRNHYRGQVARLSAALGATRLDRLTPLAVREYLRDELAAGRAPSTVAGYLTRLRQALADAARWGVLPRNPCEGVAAPRLPRAEHAVWTPAEARRFLAALDGDELRPLWLLALGSGLRVGELAALRWGDLDLDAGRLTVRRTATRAPSGREIIGETTKGRRPRVVPLPAVCVAALGAHRESMPGTPEALVFRTPHGAAWQTQRLRLRFAAACELAGVPRLTPHGLRHTAKTWAEEAGVPFAAMQASLGHAEAATTAGYGALTERMRDALADALAGALEGPSERSASH